MLVQKDQDQQRNDTNAVLFFFFEKTIPDKPRRLVPAMPTIIQVHM